ncbi:MAG: virulence RhuM family protein [Alphaproteobacteria bacterium]|nr:virulence RhuM family protein [Alphaproteobacteria bacterium]
MATELKPINGEIFLYKDDYGTVKLNGLIYGESLWLTQTAISELFNTTKQNIGQHIKNIFNDAELQENSVVKKFFTTAADGKNYETAYYNLDMIISVGYRVNSRRATQFRIWATKVLHEYIQKGFALDDERLKIAGKPFGVDYFHELLERVRSIRASERRIYQQITDIFAECSIDYDPNSETAFNFYANIQNKFHYAIHGHTAAEIIKGRASLEKPHMGLTSWKNSPNGRILKTDVSIAKNYLSEKELKDLERLVTMFFDYIEHQIEDKKAFNMAQFAESVDKLLTFNDYKVLHGLGSISAADAKQYAEAIYDEFNKTQNIESDFDRIVKLTSEK